MPSPAAVEAAQPAIRLSGLDSAVLVASVMGAGALYLLRRRRRVGGSVEQAFYDMLGLWTTIELLLIALSTLEQETFVRLGVHLPDPAEIIRNNGPLVPFALLFCALLVARSTFVTSIQAAADQDKDEEKDQGAKS